MSLLELIQLNRVHIYLMLDVLHLMVLLHFCVKFLVYFNVFLLFRIKLFVQRVHPDIEPPWVSEKHIQIFLAHILFSDLLQCFDLLLFFVKLEPSIKYLCPVLLTFHLQILCLFFQTCDYVLDVLFYTLICESCLIFVISAQLDIASKELIYSGLQIVSIILGTLNENLYRHCVHYLFFRQLDSITKLLFSPQLFEARLMNERSSNMDSCQIFRIIKFMTNLEQNTNCIVFALFQFTHLVARVYSSIPKLNAMC